MTGPSECAHHDAVVLIGHGAPATDCPRELVGELMSLEWRRQRADDARLVQRAEELDGMIRRWPRTGANDPYQAGLERIASALQPRLSPALFAVGYNEFCSPSIGEAIAQVISRGATRVFVIPSMLTPGGLHAEHDIPLALEAARRAHPGVAVAYLWPFDPERVAGLLAEQVHEALQAAPRIDAAPALTT